MSSHLGLVSTWTSDCWQMGKPATQVNADILLWVGSVSVTKQVHHALH